MSTTLYEKPLFTESQLRIGVNLALSEKMQSLFALKLAKTFQSKAAALELDCSFVLRLISSKDNGQDQK